MAFETISSGLTLVIPTSGTKNWASSLKTFAWEKISEHDHTGSGLGSQITAASITINSIVKSNLSKNLALTQATTLSLTGASPTQDVDFDNGNYQFVDVDTATGTPVLTFSNPIEGAKYSIYIIHGSGGVTDITLPTVLWPQGQAPLLSFVDNQVDRLNLYFDGTNYYGDWQLNYS